MQFVDSVHDIDYDALEATELLFDYDGTLARGSQPPSKEVLTLLEELSKRYTVRVFSNNWVYAKRREELFRTKNIAYVRTHKPFGSEEIRSDAVLIGDKILTDGLYAYRRGIQIIFIRSYKTWLLEQMHKLLA